MGRESRANPRSRDYVSPETVRKINAGLSKQFDQRALGYDEARLRNESMTPPQPRRSSLRRAVLVIMVMIMVFIAAYGLLVLL